MNRKMTRLARGAKCGSLRRHRTGRRRLLAKQARQRQRTKAAGRVLQQTAASQRIGSRCNHVMTTYPACDFTTQDTESRCNRTILGTIVPRPRVRSSADICVLSACCRRRHGGQGDRSLLRATADGRAISRNARSIRCSSVKFGQRQRSFRGSPRLFHHERTVEHQQRLRRDGRHVPLRDGAVLIGEIEHLEQLMHAVAKRRRIDAAAEIGEHVVVLGRRARRVGCASTFES